MPVLQTHLKLQRRSGHGEGSLRGSCRVNGDIGDVTGLELNISLSRHDGPVNIGRSGDLEGPEFLRTKTLVGRSPDWTVEVGQGLDGEQQVCIEADIGLTSERRSHK